ncbi:MAG: shikimate kinase [Proteobacteria bacterium]|nr:shikimate kinase [Pseudomonadota bacterium]
MNRVNSKNNIILIGMPGAGKSTTGRLLALKLEKDFIDTDNLIHLSKGKTLQEIIEDKGMKGFLAIEEEVLLKLDAQNTVISTGGSVIYRENGMAHLKSAGLLIHLDLSSQEIKKRFSDMDSRGVARAPGQTLDELFKERGPLYEKYAHTTIHCDGLSLQQVMEKIELQLSEYG